MSGLYILIAGFITSFLVVIFSTPALIKVAKLKHLVDEPKEIRKSHRWSIPTIGGIVIFGSILFSYSLWFPDEYSHISGMLVNFKYIIASLILLFFVGIKDDIIGTATLKKFISHLIVAYILVVMGNLRILNFNGLFGIDIQLEIWQSYLLSFFIYIVIANSINLIDGLDGLASGIGLISTIAFGYLFFVSGDIPIALLSIVTAGSLLGFLVFNFSPAKIFMGDSGSLILGVILYVLAINIINIQSINFVAWFEKLNKAVLAMSILAYPLLDTLRVFTIRIIRGNSPFKADNNHIHHKLIRLGMSHTKAVFILYFFSILIIVLQIILQVYFNIQNPTAIFFLQFVISFSLIISIFLFRDKKLLE